MDDLINRPLISIDIKKEMLLLENLELPTKGNHFVGKCFELQSWKMLWVTKLENSLSCKAISFFTKAALQLYPLAFWLLTRNCILRKLFCRWKAILYTFQRKCTDLCKNMFFKTASHFHFICQSLVSRPKVGNCPTWRSIYEEVDIWWLKCWVWFIMNSYQAQFLSDPGLLVRSMGQVERDLFET